MNGDAVSVLINLHHIKRLLMLIAISSGTTIAEIARVLELPEALIREELKRE